MRTPISLVRSATRYAMTPYSPAAVRSSATIANAETSTKLRRCAPTDSVIIWSIARTRPSGCCGSTAVTTVRIAGAMASGSPVVRIMSVSVRWRPSPSGVNTWRMGMNASGSGSRFKPIWRMSPTMPTISIQRVGSPKLIRRPIGSSFGQYRRAAVSLITTTGSAARSSRSVNTRPRTTRMPSVEK